MNVLFTFLEFFITILFSICVYHSIKRGKNYLVELITISIYGLLLEILGVNWAGGYVYGDFLVKIYGAPVAVALGWGVIIYTSMATVDRFDVAQKIRPFMVTLFALNIDLSMDAIAIREGLWTWTGDPGFWFNVPGPNFINWFVVSFSFSYFVYFFRKNQKMKIFYPILCMILSLIVLAIMEFIEAWYIWPIFRGEIYFFTMFAIALILTFIYVMLKKGNLKKNNKIDWIVVIMPIAFHFYFLILLLNRDYRTPALVFVSLSMLIVGTYGHLLPSWNILRKKITS